MSNKYIVAQTDDQTQGGNASPSYNYCHSLTRYWFHRNNKKVPKGLLHETLEGGSIQLLSAR